MDAARTPAARQPGRPLLHAARLIRDPDRYIARFGRENYDIKLGDCLWHIYRMIGKLSSRIYLLSAPEAATDTEVIESILARAAHRPAPQ